jgi:hypothetical protein
MLTSSEDRPGGIMYLYSRAALLHGPLGHSLAWAMEVTEYVNEHSDLDVAMWRVDFGHPLGTTVWSAVVESRAALAAATASLTTKKYADLVDAGAKFRLGAPEDALRQHVHGHQGDTPAIGSSSLVVTATAMPGKMADAVAWGMTMTDHVARATGANTSFFVDAYGPFGQLTWISNAPDLAAVDAGNDAVAADAAYHEGLAASGHLFVPGSGHNALLTRIA